MPSRIHELFLIKLVDEIRNQIAEKVAQAPSSPVSLILRNIQYYASSDVEEPRSNNDRKPSQHHRSPDASLGFEVSQFPSLIIECSYAQRNKNLRRIADDYVMMSDGNTKMVVGVDIGYRPRRGEELVDKVLIWEAKESMETIDGKLMSVLETECTLDKASQHAHCSEVLVT